MYKIFFSFLMLSLSLSVGFSQSNCSDIIELSSSGKVVQVPVSEILLVEQRGLELLVSTTLTTYTSNQYNIDDFTDLLCFSRYNPKQFTAGSKYAFNGNRVREIGLNPSCNCAYLMINEKKIDVNETVQQLVANTMTATTALQSSLGDWNSLSNIPAGFNDNVDNYIDDDADPTNEIQEIRANGDTIFLSGSNYIVLPIPEPIDWNNYIPCLKLYGDTLEILGGNTVILDKIGRDSIYINGNWYANGDSINIVSTDTTFVLSQIMLYDTSFTNELITNVQIVNDSLYITESGYLIKVDLSSFKDPTDTSFILTQVSNALAEAYLKDTSFTNEIMTNFSLDGDTLKITEAGNNFTVNLSKYITPTDSAYILSKIQENMAYIFLRDTSFTNELISSFIVASDTIFIEEGGYSYFVDLTPYLTPLDTAFLQDYLENSGILAQSLAIQDSMLYLTGGSNIVMTKEGDNEQLFIDEAGNKKKYVFEGTVLLTDNQSLGLTGTTLTLDSSPNVDLKDLELVGGVDTLFVDGQYLKFSIDNVIYSIMLEDCSQYDDQTLLLSGDTLYIENGNFVDLGAYVNPPPASIMPLSQMPSMAIGNSDLVIQNDSLYVVGSEGVNLSIYNDVGRLLDSVATLKALIDVHKTQWQQDENGELSYMGGELGLGTIDPRGILHIEMGDGEDDIVFKHSGLADVFDMQFRENNTATNGVRYNGSLLGDKNKLEIFNYVDSLPIAQFENSGEFWLPAYAQDTIDTAPVSLLGIAANGKVVNANLAPTVWTENVDGIYYDGGDALITNVEPKIKLNDSDTVSNSIFGWDIKGNAEGLGIWSTKFTDPLGLATEVLRIDRSSYSLLPNYFSSIVKTGIGTLSPINMLDVEGGVAIGATYSGTNTAPTNGLIVEGNLGLGVVSPTMKLEIQPNASQETVFLGRNSGYATIKSFPTQWLIMDGNDANVALNYYNSSDVILGYGGGDVGIGYLSPAAKLDINAGSNTTGIRLRGLAETAEIGDIFMGSLGNMIISTVNSTDTGPHIDLRSSDDQYGIIIRESDGTGTTTYGNIYVTDAADDYMEFVVNSREDGAGLNVTASNNVGIGTTTPSAKLEVNGQTSLIGGLTGATPTPLLKFNSYSDNSGNPSASHIELYPNYGFGISSSTLNYISSGNHRFNDASGNQKMNLATSTGKLQLNTYGVGSNVGTATYALAVDASGNVIEEALGGTNTWYNVIYGANIDNGGYANLQCMCNADGQVFFKGSMRATTTMNGNTTLLTLPIQCRPNRIFHTNSDWLNITTGNSQGEYPLKINTNGVITSAYPMYTNYSINMHTITYNKNL